MIKIPRYIPLAYVLAGGEGKRLYPLTRDRAKSAVPFGGTGRLIDYVLTNLYHSDIRKVFVLDQYESESLERHVTYGWNPRFGTGTDEFIRMLPAMKGERSGWFEGTADAVSQKRRYIEETKTNVVDVFGGDHVYFMDISQMNDFHLQAGADLTISASPVKREIAAKRFGVLTVDSNWQLQDFKEKPENPIPMPNNNEYCLVSMGNYSFNPEVLIEELNEDQKKETTADREAVMSNPNRFSSHDFSYDLIPAMMLRKGRKIFVYDFMKNSFLGMSEKERGYWRDIGNLDEYYEANMEIRSITPPLNLYNTDWEFLTYTESTQPAKFIGNCGKDSLTSNGVIISNANATGSVLSYNVKVEDGAEIINSILMGNNHVGKKAVIKDSIVDRRVIIPDGETIGIDREKDTRRGFTISPKGITAVPRNYKF